MQAPGVGGVLRSQREAWPPFPGGLQVAVGIHMDDIESAIQTYNLLSERWFTHATPTLFNAATPRPQMSSCFLVQMRDDSIEGIYDTLKTTALISKSAGGTKSVCLDSENCGVGPRMC